MSDPKKYTVGWICAKEPEFVAAQAFLDEEHRPLETRDFQDYNAYALGKIGPHNVVIASLPVGEYGTDSAAVVAKDLLRTFPNVRIGLMVGIGGGAPSCQHDIRLGDVVVSQPGDGKGGVFQYDFGKIVQDQPFWETRFLNQPPNCLRTAIGLLKSRYARLGHNLEGQINNVLEKWPKLSEIYSRPASIDILYKSTFVHQGGPGSKCKSCGEDPENIAMRSQRDEHADNPAIHYGLIASGNKLMKDATIRDKLAKEKSILCFEMEAAGLMNHFPCVVIRGICDYSDSHKNKVWQGYAAMTAAAYATDLLQLIPASNVESEKTILDKLSSVCGDIKSLCSTTDMVKSELDTESEQKIRNWFSTLSISTTYNKSIQTRSPGTGQWLLSSSIYEAWRNNSAGLLWLYGAAGSGKTMLCSTAIEDVSRHVQHNPEIKQAYWYFQFSDIATQDVSTMVRSFIRQLTPSPPLGSTQRLWKNHNQRGSEPTLDELTGILDEIINNSREVFIIIDALDECQQTSQLQERTSLLKYVNTFMDKHKIKLHLLVTSRVEHDIKSALERHKSMNIEKWIDKDVKMYLEEQIHSGCLAEYQDIVKNKIKDSLLLTEERRFRWVDLQVRRLRACSSAEQIVTALKTVPETLEDFYKETLDKIPLKDKKLAREILMWLCFSLRPMTTAEIATAVGLLHPQNALRICSTMLVTLVHERTEDMIQLAHFTVKEYLVAKKESNNMFEHQFTEESAHDTLARTTVNSLLSYNTTSMPASRLQNRFLDYSARFWYRHAIIPQGNAEYSQLTRDIDRLFSPEYSASFKTWLQTYNCDSPRQSFNGKSIYSLNLRRQKFPQPLYYASLLGFYESVRKLLLEGSKVIKEGSAGNAILAAVKNGHHNIVQELLARFRKLREVDIWRTVKLIRANAHSILLMHLKDYTFTITERILMAAAENRQSGEIIMTLLLSIREEGIKITNRVVEAAVKNERSGKNILAVLLDRKGKEINITRTLVMATAKNRLRGKDIMVALLDRREEDMKITYDAAVEIVRGFDEDITSLLFDRRGKNYSARRAFYSVRNKTIKPLLIG